MADEAEGSKALVLKLYGEELGPKLAWAAGYGRGYDWRKVIEPTDATTQCEKSDRAYHPGMDCYMCGRPIPAKETMPKGSVDELWPECEHVLPLTEGRWLLDIYISKRVMSDPWSKTARHLEYDQAHRVCNQAKRVQSYIEDSLDGTFTVSLSAIEAILKDVVKRAQTNLKTKGDTRLTMREIAGMNVSVRAKAIYDRVKQCVDHINQAPFQKAAAPGLVVLMRTAFLIDPDTLVPAAREVHDEWYAGAGVREEAYQRNLLTFLRDTEADYPMLASSETRMAFLTRLIARDESERAFVNSVVPPLENVLRRIFDAKSAAETPVDPSGAHFLSLVTYGLLEALYTQLQTAGDPQSLRLRCEIHQRMSRIATLPGPKDDRGRDTAPLEPQATAVFGALPVLSAADAKACATFAAKDARDKRAQSPEEEEASPRDISDEILQGLDRGLDATLERWVGIEPTLETKAPLMAYARKCIATYLAAFPSNIYEAQLVAARAVAEKGEVQLALIQGGLTSDAYRDALFAESRVFAEGAGRRKRKTYRRKSKRRKTLRKKVRA
jgi:hypothetical protein